MWRELLPIYNTRARILGRARVKVLFSLVTLWGRRYKATSGHKALRYIRILRARARVKLSRSLSLTAACARACDKTKKARRGARGPDLHSSLDFSLFAFDDYAGDAVVARREGSCCCYRVYTKKKKKSRRDLVKTAAAAAAASSLSPGV